MSEAVSMTYVAMRPCGCISMAASDTPERAKEVAREVAKAIRLGETVSYVTSETFRTMDWECETHHAARLAKEQAKPRQRRAQMVQGALL